MVYFMQEYKDILIKNSIEKSKRALSDAKFNMENNRYETAMNRIYYSIFYVVLALGYASDFITSKHLQLMGWFNRKFIYEDKVFEKKLKDIYKTAYEQRQESDYNLNKDFLLDYNEVSRSFDDAHYFINSIEEFINNNYRI
jgi:uncharacterized protein